MGQSRESEVSIAQTIRKRMTAASQGSVDKEIHFANDDVPKYLENLRRFQEESRKVEIVVR